MEARSSSSAGITLLLLIKDKSGCPTLSALSLLSPPLDRCLDLYVFVHKAVAEVIKPTLGCRAEIFSLLIGAGKVEKLSEAAAVADCLHMAFCSVFFLLLISAHRLHRGLVFFWMNGKMKARVHSLMFIFT